jgi:hypothetical protein
MRHRLEGNGQAAFVVSDGSYFVAAEHNRPHVLANLGGRFDKQVVRVVHRSAARGQISGDEGVFASHTVIGAPRKSQPAAHETLTFRVISVPASISPGTDRIISTVVVCVVIAMQNAPGSALAASCPPGCNHD